MIGNFTCPTLGIVSYDLGFYFIIRFHWFLLGFTVALLAKYQFYLIPYIMFLLQNVILEIVCFIVLFLL